MLWFAILIILYLNSPCLCGFACDVECRLIANLLHAIISIPGNLIQLLLVSSDIKLLNKRFFEVDGDVSQWGESYKDKEGWRASEEQYGMISPLLRSN